MELLPASWDVIPEILEKLKKNNWPDSKTAYNKLKAHSSIRVKFPEHECRLLTPGGKLDDNATFVLMIPDHRYELHVETLASDLKSLAYALVHSPSIDWTKSPTFSCLHSRLYPLLDLLEEQLINSKRIECPTRSFHLTAERALEISVKIPDDVLLRSVTLDYAEFINSHWPHGKTPQSLQEVVDHIKFNESVGIFKKESGDLVAWCLYGHYGGAGLLHVLEGHRQKGYGEIALAAISQIVAKDGIDPHAFITLQNTASIKLFTKLGYEEKYSASWSTFLYEKFTAK